jgi:hypothetical protein
MMQFTGEDFVARLMGEMRASIQQGRFFPLVWVEHMAVYCTFRDVVSYKRFLVVSCLVDLALLMVLVRLIAGNWRLASLSAAMTTLLFQFRTFFDPILAFHGLLQLVTALVIGSLITLRLYLDGRGKCWLWASSAMHLACLLLYEVTYPLFMLHATLIGLSRPDWRSRLLAVLPFLLMTAACVGASVLVRRTYPNDSYIHAINLSPVSVALALAKQASAALPLSAFLADPAGLFEGLDSPGAITRWLARGDVLLVALLAGTATAIGVRPRGADQDQGTGERAGWILPTLGLLLAVLPGVMIAVSRRYQGELAFGVGYLPVYLQYFGVGMLTAWGLRSALIRLERGRWAVVTLAGAIALVAAMTYRSNVEVAIRLNAPPGTPYYNPVAAGMAGEHHYQRLNLEAAVRSGLMEEVPDGATLHLENPYPHWHSEPNSTFFYLMHLGRNSLFTRARSADAEVPAEDAFVVRDVCLGRETGYVVLWRVGPDDEPFGTIRVFVRAPHLNLENSGPAFAVHSTANAPQSEPQVTPGSQLPILRSDANWVVCELDEELDPETIRVMFDRQPIAKGIDDLKAARSATIR